MSCTTPQTTPAPIRVPRGQSRTLTITVRDSSNALVDLTGSKVWFTVKNRLESVDATIAKKNVTAGGVDGQILISPQSGSTKSKYKVFLTPPDTSGLDPGASFWCDSWIEVPSGMRFQVLSNRQFIVDPVVTTSFV